MIGAFHQLSDYLDDVRRLLHDPRDEYWPVADKIVYVNRGIQRRDLDCGQNRVLFPFTLTVGTDTYSFLDLVAQNPQPPRGPTAVTAGAGSAVIALSPVQTVGYSVFATASWGATVTVGTAIAGSFTATFSTAAPAGAQLYWQLYGGRVRPNAANVFDVVGLNIIMNNVRYVMGQFSFTELNTTVRMYSPPLQWMPVRWCRYAPQGIVFGPAPSIAYVTEWDCSTFTPTLSYLPDVDLLPFPYTMCVGYYAAYLAKVNERQYDESEGFKNLYDSQLLAATNSRVGQVPNMYSAGVTRI